MKNPFEKKDIKLKLSFNELLTLFGMISSLVPNTNDEAIIITVHEQIKKELDRIASE